MRICVFGAGAIGGYIAAKLAAGGEAELSLVARGAHLAAIRRDGLRLIENGAQTVARINAADDTASLPPQDYVIWAVKAHQAAATVPALRRLLGPDTAVVTAQNGVPWWYFYGQPGAYEGTRVATVDPDGAIWDGVGPDRAIGAVVYIAAEISAPGIIAHMAENRFTLGEPSGEKSMRAARLSKALIDAGIKAPVKPDIRSEIWVKLWGNVSFNPISALTGATLDAIVADPGTRSLARSMMVEAEAIATRLGVRFPVDVDRRIAGAGAVGAHKTSMLQDLEHGRPMEIDALVASVQELGRLTGVATPSIDAVLALVRRLAIERGLYAAPPAPAAVAEAAGGRRS